jgi:hypothetical protein
MPKTSIASIRVNDVRFEWTDDSRRKPRECRGCKKQTTGRRDEIGGRSSAWCLECTFTDAFQKGTT